MTRWIKRLITTFTLAMAACASAPTSDTPLRIAGRPDVMEMGPIYYAAAELSPDDTIVMPGGVPNLFRSDAQAHAGTSFDPWPGQADLAGQAETQALRISIANPNLRILMTVTEGVYRIVARRSAGIETLADLRGKRVAAFANTSSAYFLHRMLRSAGMTEADIQFVDLRPRDMSAAILEGRVDAIAIWEPESERAHVGLGADAVAFQDPNAYRELYNLNTTAEALADPAKRAQIVRFARAVIEAARVSETNPQTVWPLVAAQSGYDVDTIAAGWRHHRFPAALPADLLDVLVDEEQWFAAQTNRTPRTREELARLIDASILEEALAP
jgi:NitT/TauT family transport system substrate-binding protein